MTGADWGILAAAAAAFLTAAASWLKSRATNKALLAHSRAPAFPAHPGQPQPPSAPQRRF